MMEKGFWKSNVASAEGVIQRMGFTPVRNLGKRIGGWWQNLWAKGVFVLTLMAFFLGRAEILGEITPFALAYYAVILRFKKSAAQKVKLALTAGFIAAHGIFSNWWVILAMLVLYHAIHRILSKNKALEFGAIPLVVFLVDAAVRLTAAVAHGDLSRYALLMGVVEAFLATVLTMIFIQSIPVFTFQRGVKELRNEEIICLVILMASVLTGFTGLALGNISLVNIFSRYLIMLFSLIGGAGVGAGVGVVTGIILSMSSLTAVSQIGLLAFSGVLGGLLRDAKKIGVGLGFMLGTAILTVYVADMSQLVTGLEESAAAFALLFLTPKSLIEQVARYVPGTHQHTLSQQDYARRIRELMDHRIREVSNVFQELSNTFSQISVGHVRPPDELLNKTLEHVSQQVCSGCFKREQCWGKHFMETYQGMVDSLTLIDIDGHLESRNLAPALRKRCIKTEPITQALNRAAEFVKRDAKWQAMLAESRDLVSAQLTGVAKIMSELAGEIRKENHLSADQEEHIMAALEQLGLTIRTVDIISLDEGKVEIEVTYAGCGDYNECAKVIAPLLSEILGENITVAQKRSEAEGFCTVTLTSAKVYQVEVGVASAAKDGKMLSGDSFTSLDVGNGKYAVAVSDGMGNGERAMQESSAAIRLLQQMLKAGFDEKLAIQTVNSVLLLRSQDEIFTTMDLALIDLYSAKTEFLKIGSAPSFIKRGTKVFPINGANIPIGILQEIEIQAVEADLEEGDLLILVSDGVYDAAKLGDQTEAWLKQQIECMEIEDPQAIADVLLELAVRMNNGEIHDDMTVLVAKISKFQPEWSTIKIPGLKKIKRRKGGKHKMVPLSQGTPGL
jgi:stage II sporulation protein E